MKYVIDKNIKKQVDTLIDSLDLKHIKKKYIYCIKSFDAKTRAYARIWGMAKIFSEVAGIKPRYIIEVISPKFDKLNDRERIKTLIHELLHIPKTFSGALLSHRGKGRRINDAEVERVIRNLS
ncbi:MAG: putative metallopeptidase [Patescibacteria group bacterium]